jgi:3-hydroxyisobutyrate dehydrogenase-like beta-hydroxyacid dehydrogenase
LAPGTIILDATTGDPEEMAALGRRLARRRVRYLDTTILGSSADVAAGRAVVMAGGMRADFLSNSDLLGCFAAKQFHLGSYGSGARMKLVVNLVLGLNRAALAEGLAFAQATGVSPARALEVLRSGLAYSRVMDAKGPKMLRRDFKPVARLAQHLKDVRLIIEAARKTGLAVPLTAQHQKLLARVAARGCGNLDNSAVILAYD